jgi:hypothetical protein
MPWLELAAVFAGMSSFLLGMLALRLARKGVDEDDESGSDWDK